MVVITESMYIWIDVALVLFYALMCFLGYRKGILRTVIDLVGTAAVIYLSWLLAPILSDFAHIFPSDFAPMQDTVMSSAVYQFCNELLWFLILFVILKIILALLENIAKGIQSIPGLHFISSILGGIFHVIIGLLWTLVFCIVLSLPVFEGGDAAINGTLLGTVRTAVNEIASTYVEPFMDTEAFSTLFEDATELKEDQQETIRKWLIDHGYTEEKFDQVVEESQ